MHVCEKDMGYVSQDSNTGSGSSECELYDGGSGSGSGSESDSDGLEDHFKALYIGRAPMRNNDAREIRKGSQPYQTHNRNLQSGGTVLTSDHLNLTNLTTLYTQTTVTALQQSSYVRNIPNIVHNILPQQDSSYTNHNIQDDGQPDSQLQHEHRNIRQDDVANVRFEMEDLDVSNSDFYQKTLKQLALDESKVLPCLDKVNLFDELVSEAYFDQQQPATVTEMEELNSSHSYMWSQRQQEYASSLSPTSSASRSGSVDLSSPAYCGSTTTTNSDQQLSPAIPTTVLEHDHRNIVESEHESEHDHEHQQPIHAKEQLKRKVNSNMELKKRNWIAMCKKTIDDFLRVDKYGLNYLQSLASKCNREVETVLYACVEVFRNNKKISVKQIECGLGRRPTVLQLVALRNEPLLTMYLLEVMTEHGIAIQPDEQGRTLLHLLCDQQHGDYLKIISQLLSVQNENNQSVFSVNATDQNGMRPLDVALKRGPDGEQLVALLVRHGATHTHIT